MKTCEKCGELNGERLDKCYKCHADLPNAPLKSELATYMPKYDKVCAVCKDILKPDATKCPSCGSTRIQSQRNRDWGKTDQDYEDSTHEVISLKTTMRIYLLILLVAAFALIALSIFRFAIIPKFNSYIKSSPRQFFIAICMSIFTFIAIIGRAEKPESIASTGQKALHVVE